MLILANRIEELEKLRETILESDETSISRKSYCDILKMHIQLLREVYNLASAFTNNDVEEVQKWYNYRALDLTE